MKGALLLLAFATAPLLAVSQPIYRCGPQGTVYSQVPCAGGTVLDVSDPRTAAQREQARRVAAQERRTAAQLERERLARERDSSAAPASLSGGKPVATASSAATGGTGSHKKGKTDAPAPKGFVGLAPKTPTAPRAPPAR